MGRTEQTASDMPRAVRVQTMSVYLPGLRKHRERANLKRAELARRLRSPNGLGIDEDTPGRWELPKANPRHRRTPIGYLSQLTEILGCTEDDLLGDEPRPIAAIAYTEPELPAVLAIAPSETYYRHEITLHCLMCGAEHCLTYERTTSQAICPPAKPCARGERHGQSVLAAYVVTPHQRHTVNPFAPGADAPTTLYCARCDQLKPAAEFSYDRIQPTGRQRHCKQCTGAGRRSQTPAVLQDKVPA